MANPRGVVLAIILTLPLVWVSSNPSLISEGAPEAPEVPRAAEGVVSVRHLPASSVTLEAAAALIAESGLLEEEADRIRRHLVLPADVSIVAMRCGQPNAFWAEASRTITLCYELVALLNQEFATISAGNVSEPETLSARTIDAVRFVLRHEFGHMAVSLYDLPITGREEDVADQFATWFSLRDNARYLSGLTRGELQAAAGMDAFAALARSTGVDEKSGTDLKWWSEHTFSLARVYNVMCWLYGANPAGFSHLANAGNGSLPLERATTCGQEHLAIDRAFTRLLGGHVRTHDPGWSGEVRVIYENASDPALIEWARILSMTDFFGGEAAAYSKTFAIPDDVLVRWRQCGIATVSYDAPARELVLCYEFPQFLETTLLRVEAVAAREDAAQGARGFAVLATRFLLHHGMAHILFSDFDIAVVGREEDVANQFAVFMSLRNDTAVGGEVLTMGEGSIFGGVAAFLAFAHEAAQNETRAAEFPWWSQHSMHLTTVYNLLCWLYGSSPERLDPLTVPTEDPWDPYLRPSRAAGCEAEYRQAVAGLHAVLGTHMRARVAA